MTNFFVNEESEKKKIIQLLYKRPEIVKDIFEKMFDSNTNKGTLKIFTEQVEFKILDFNTVEKFYKIYSTWKYKEC